MKKNANKDKDLIHIQIIHKSKDAKNFTTPYYNLQSKTYKLIGYFIRY